MVPRENKSKILEGQTNVEYFMERALYGVYTLFFVSEISLVLFAHLFDF